MGTLMDKLNATNATKVQIRQAIERKKVSVPENTPLKDYPAKIDGIYPDALFLKDCKFGKLPISSFFGHSLYVKKTDGKSFFLAVNGYSYNSSCEYAYGTDEAGWVKKEIICNSQRVYGRWEKLTLVNNKVFIVSGGPYTNAYTNFLVYSDDGLNWKKSTFPSKKRWMNIVYKNGKYFVFGTEGSDISVLQSSDLQSWSEITSLYIKTGDTPYSVYYFKNKVFVFCGDPRTVYYTEDMKTWTQKSTNIQYSSWGKNIAIKDDTLAVLVNNKNTYTSTDFINWTMTQHDEYIGSDNRDIFNVCYNDGFFVASNSTDISYYGGGISYSQDGVAWKHLDFNESKGTSYIAPVFAEGKLIAFAEESNKVIYSIDFNSAQLKLGKLIENSSGEPVTLEVLKSLNVIQTATLQAAYEAGVNSI